MGGWFGGGDAGAADDAAARGYLSREGIIGDQYNRLGNYGSGNFYNDDPAMRQFLQGRIRRSQDVYDNGLSQPDQDQFMAGIGAGGTDAYRLSIAQQRQSDAARGIDTSDGSTNSVTAGSEAAMSGDALQSYMQARARLAGANLQAKQNAGNQIAGDESTLVSGDRGTMQTGYGGADNIYSNIGSTYRSMAADERAQQQQNQMGMLNAIGGVVEGGIGAGWFGGGRRNRQQPASPSAPAYQPPPYSGYDGGPGYGTAPSPDWT